MQKRENASLRAAGYRKEQGDGKKGRDICALSVCVKTELVPLKTLL